MGKGYHPQDRSSTSCGSETGAQIGNLQILSLDETARHCPKWLNLKINRAMPGYLLVPSHHPTWQLTHHLLPNFSGAGHLATRVGFANGCREEMFSPPRGKQDGMHPRTLVLTSMTVQPTSPKIVTKLLPENNGCQKCLQMMRK